MSSLDQDDADKQLQQAVPWVSDPDNQEQRDEQTRRLQEDVVEAAKRLERESVLLPSQPSADLQTVVTFRVPVARVPASQVRKEEVSPEERARQIWADLKPQFISPQEKAGTRRLVMAAGLLSAMAVSAIAATIVVNIVHLPTISTELAGEPRAPKGDSHAAASLGDLAKFSEAQAKMTRPDEPAVPPESLLASAPPNDIAAPKYPDPVNPQPAKVEPVRPEIVALAPSPLAAVNAVPEPRPAAVPLQPAAVPLQPAAVPLQPGAVPPQSTAVPPQPAAVPLQPAAVPLQPAAAPLQPAAVPPQASPLPQDEAASLLKRGQDLLAAGDIASARLMLTLVAEAGNAEACVILAGTFDPTVLAKLRAVGVQGDPAKARAWYARAAELGSFEARQRLQALR
jgi:hypothetical protein